MNQDFFKLDRFDGTNYNRWKDQMMFLLTVLNISYVLDDNLVVIPDPTEDESQEDQRNKRDKDEVLCRGHILNRFSDRLYNLLTAIKSPKEIWNTLETRYNKEKQDKLVMDQVNDLQSIVNKLKELKVDISEPLQVGAVIAKLPTSWNNCRKKLMHTNEELSLEQLQKHLR
ncbi:hypothetical protein V2J09_021883 [Rumex salicifolius]